MLKEFFSSTVIESCHPYHRLVGGNNARKSIKDRRKSSFNHEIDCRNSCNPKELILAPTANL